MNLEIRRVCVIDDIDEIRESLKLMINAIKEYNVIGDYSNCEDALRQLSSDRPDIVNH